MHAQVESEKDKKMKKQSIFLAANLLVLMGCGGDKSATDSLVTIDVTANYPKKELILQDFMDVDYIPLETTDEFVTRGKIMDVGKDIIIVSNGREGDILIFDRKTGKSLRKINRKGQGPEEYLMLINVILDEDKGEIFVNAGPTSQLQVYNLHGDFKRTIQYKKGALVSNIYNYDNDYLVCQDTYTPENTNSVHTFFLISKQDGKMKDIEIPVEKKISTVMLKRIGNMVSGNGPRNSCIAFFQNNWILTETSADTVYMKQSDHALRPFIVRTPSVQTMNPEVFLYPGVLTDRYSFMQTVKKEYNFETGKGFPTTDLVYDREDKKIYEYTVSNNDFSERSESMFLKYTNDKIVFSVTLAADELVEAYEQGELKGKLKEIAAKLDEEDNPVIMLVKHKK